MSASLLHNRSDTGHTQCGKGIGRIAGSHVTMWTGREAAAAAQPRLLGSPACLAGDFPQAVQTLLRRTLVCMS